MTTFILFMSVSLHARLKSHYNRHWDTHTFSNSLRISINETNNLQYRSSKLLLIVIQSNKYNLKRASSNHNFTCVKKLFKRQHCKQNLVRKCMNILHFVHTLFIPCDLNHYISMKSLYCYL